MSVLCMYRFHHEVEVSMGFTHRGPEARGCVNCVETEPSDVTDLYHGLCGPDNRIYGLATTAPAIKGSSAYLATVQTIVIDWVDAGHRCIVVSRRRFLSNSSSSLTFRTTILYRRCVQKNGHVIAVLISIRGSQSGSSVLTWQSFAPPIQSKTCPLISKGSDPVMKHVPVMKQRAN